MANQDKLYLAFHGDDLAYRFTKVVRHDRQNWQCIDELMAEALAHWERIPSEQRDLDRAKEEFMQQFE